MSLDIKDVARQLTVVRDVTQTDLLQQTVSPTLRTAFGALYRSVMNVDEFLEACGCTDEQLASTFRTAIADARKIKDGYPPSTSISKAEQLRPFLRYPDTIPGMPKAFERRYLDTPAVQRISQLDSLLVSLDVRNAINRVMVPVSKTDRDLLCIATDPERFAADHPDESFDVFFARMRAQYEKLPVTTIDLSDDLEMVDGFDGTDRTNAQISFLRAFARMVPL